MGIKRPDHTHAITGGTGFAYNTNTTPLYNNNIVSTPTYTGTYTGANWGTGIPVSDQIVIEAVMEGLDELAEVLEVYPVVPGQPGVMIRGVSGSLYSLFDILQSQTKLMMRLNTLLIHRNLGKNNDEE